MSRIGLFGKRLASEYQALRKPTVRQLWHNTCVTCLLAIAGAIVVSGFDILVTNVLRLFV